MTAWQLDALTSQRRRERLLEAERERLAGPARAHRRRRHVAGRAAASLGQLMAAHREAVVR